MTKNGTWYNHRPNFVTRFHLTSHRGHSFSICSGHSTLTHHCMQDVDAFPPKCVPGFPKPGKNPDSVGTYNKPLQFFFFLIHANIEIIKLRQIHSNDFSFWFMIHHKIKYQVLKQARECFFFIVHVCAFEKSDKKNITITVAYFLLFWQRSAIVLGR